MNAPNYISPLLSPFYIGKIPAGAGPGRRVHPVGHGGAAVGRRSGALLRHVQLLLDRVAAQPGALHRGGQRRARVKVKAAGVPAFLSASVGSALHT